MTIQIKDIKIPERATKTSAGYDLASAEDVLIKPKEIVLIKTGLKVSIPKDEVLLVFPRSSLAMKRGLMMSNGVGVVDADYYNNPNNEGHLMIPLYNFTDKEVLVKKVKGSHKVSLLNTALLQMMKQMVQNVLVALVVVVSIKSYYLQ